MARPTTFTREAVLKAAVDIVRRDGEEGLTSRNIGKELGCSSRPMFTLYDNMESLRLDVRKEAVKLFSKFVEDCLDYFPAFKEYGMRMVRFGIEEHNLFRMIFFSQELTREDFGRPLAVCEDAFVKDYDLSIEQADKLASHLWTFVCGLATLAHTGAIHLTEEQIRDRLSEQFVGMLTFMKSGRDVHGVIPQKREKDDRITKAI